MSEERPVYKIMDKRGRITIPKELRTKADIENGDVIHLYAEEEKVCIRKVEVVHAEIGDKKRIESTVFSALSEMDESSLLKTSRKIVRLLENKKKKGKHK